MGQEWATPERDDTDYRGITHTQGIFPTQKGIRMYLSRPRPKGFDLNEWERLEQEKWERIFPKEA